MRMQRSPVPGSLSTNTSAYSRPSATLVSTTNQGHGQGANRISGYNQGLSSPLISPAPVPSSSTATSSNLPGTSQQQPVENVQKEEIKSHFTTAEGIYKKMTVATYSRPNKSTIINTGTNSMPNCPVKVSFASLPSPPQCSCPEENPRNFCSEKICFNVGRELFVFDYVGVHGSPNLAFPIDKRIYKGTFPTCHDFNQYASTHESCQLIIGFSAGQVQLIDPLQKDYVPSKLFNEERNIDKSAATCVKWIPGHANCFMVSHVSGNIYVYNELLTCPEDAPIFQVFKQGEGYTVFTVKSKVQKNPLTRIQIGSASTVNEFDFYQSESCLQLAVVSQDGYLRIFDYQKMELMGVMKSYFGGLQCLAWSPDGKLIATGGEDDLLTVFSVTEKRVVCRGQGHKSFISRVAFDPYVTGLSAAASSSSIGDGLDDNIDGTANVVFTTACVNKYGCEEPTQINGHVETQPMAQQPPVINIVSSPSINGVDYKMNTSYSQNSMGNDVNLKKNASVSNTSVNYAGIELSQTSIYSGYRIGTVSHDTQLLLWDLGDDIISNPAQAAKRMNGPTIISVGLASGADANPMSASTSSEGGDSARGHVPDIATSSTSSAKSKLKKLHKRGFSFGSRLSRAVGITSAPQQNGTANGHAGNGQSAFTVFGSPICPKMNDVPVIEPLLNKKIAHERLTALFFREESIVTGCQEGFVCTWARPGRARKHSVGSIKTNTSMAGVVDSYSPGAIHV